VFGRVRQSLRCPQPDNADRSGQDQAPVHTRRGPRPPRAGPFHGSPVQAVIGWQLHLLVLRPGLRHRGRALAADARPERRDGAGRHLCAGPRLGGHQQQPRRRPAAHARALLQGGRRLALCRQAGAGADAPGQGAADAQPAARRPRAALARRAGRPARRLRPPLPRQGPHPRNETRVRHGFPARPRHRRS
jgi:hypothetical protein